MVMQGMELLYRPKDNTKEGGMDYVNACGYMGEPSDSLDVMFMGSSLFFSGVMPLQLWGTSGITSYDVATGSQWADQTDRYVRNMLKTHHPKLVVLDAYALTEEINLDESIYYEWVRFFPLLYDHENWKRLAPQQLLAPVHYTHTEELKGFLPRTRTKAVNLEGYMAPTEETWHLPLLNRFYIDRICRMCHSAGAEVLILAIPSPDNWDYPLHNAMEEYTRKKGIDFLDMALLVDELQLDGSTDFRDGGNHVNTKGAIKLSVYLAHYLQEHYQLDDHRDDPAYAQWAEDWANNPQ